MKTQGEYLFSSFEDALAFVVPRLSNFERDAGIKLADDPLTVLNTEDLKLVLLPKSDGSASFILFFRNSTKFDVWKFWALTKAQLKSAGIALDIMKGVDMMNGLKGVGPKC